MKWSIGLGVAAFQLQLASATNAGDMVISRHIPDCAKPCLAQTLQNAFCSPDDLDCTCQAAWNSPVFNGCSMAACNIAEALAAINGTATACDIPVAGQTPALLVATVVIGLVAIAGIIVRLSGRRVAGSKRLQKVDDWLMIGIALVLIGIMVCTILVHRHGYGRDTWYLPTRQIRSILILVYILELQYTVIIHLIKLSISYFYLDFFPYAVFPELRTTIYVTMAAVVASGIGFSTAVTFQCVPISSFWDAFNEYVQPVELEKKRCINPSAFALANASINIAFDVWLMILPMVELIKLSLPLRKKIVVCLMFAMGNFVTVVTIPRLLYMEHIEVSMNPIHDLMWASFWAHLECTICVLLACVPAICIALGRQYHKYAGSCSASPDESPAPVSVNIGTWPGHPPGSTRSVGSGVNAGSETTLVNTTGSQRDYGYSGVSVSENV